MISMNTKSKIIKAFSLANISLIALKSDLDLSITKNLGDSIAYLCKIGNRPFIYGSNLSNYFLWGFAALGIAATYINKTDKSKPRKK